MRQVVSLQLGSLLATAGLLLLSGCTPPPSTQQAPAASPSTPTGVVSNTPPPAASVKPAPAPKPAAKAGPAAPESDIQAAAAGNNAFGIDLYHRLVAGNVHNLIFSPISISAALGMSYAGAKGDTAKEMSQALHFTLPQEKLHPALGNVLWRLQPQDAKKAAGFTLRVANSMWVDKKFKLLDPFSNTIKTNYLAPTDLVDFAHQPDQARQSINQWVAQRTEDKIKDLLGQGTIKPITKVVLVNAIYFHAQWMTEFVKDATSDRPFRTASGKSKKVPTMAVESKFRYAKGKGYKALQMSYRGPSNMVVVLPDSKLSTLEKQLSTAWFADLDKKLQSETVNVQLPKFKVAPDTVNLKAVLKRMGMNKAFGTQADFSGVDGAKDLLISGIFHKAFIDVNERGTEAAAATAAVMGLKSAMMPKKPVDFHADRPFLFFIRDTGTGAILFAGRVMDPSVN